MSQTSGIPWALLTVGLVVAAAAAADPPGLSEPANAPLAQPDPLEQPMLETLLRLTNTPDSDGPSVRSLMSEHAWERQFTPGLSTVDILALSGFGHELHESVSLDGYVTQLVRMVNPLLERRHRRATPVVLYTGQGASPAAFLATSSAGSRRPLAWSPTVDDDLFAEQHELGEANRSLAVMLANNGFDVWLVPTRGVDAQNRQRRAPKDWPPISSRKLDGLADGLLAAGDPDQLGLQLAAKVQAAGQLESDLAKKAPDLGAKTRRLTKKFSADHYWSFSSDEIIEFELESQLETVRAASGAEKLSLVSYSNGGFIVFGFLAGNPAYASQHLDAVVCLAPAVFVSRLNPVLALASAASTFNPPSWPFPEDQVSALMRHGVLHHCKSKAFRYSICKALINKLYGESDLFRTQLDLAIFEHIGLPMSANGLRQILQVAESRRLRQYDHGLLGNLLVYGRSRPDAYELGQVLHEHLYVFSGGRDAIADPQSVTYLVGALGVRPDFWKQIPAYNHLDLLVARDNAAQVNLPVLQVLVDRDLEASYYREETDERTSKSKSRHEERTHSHRHEEEDSFREETNENTDSDLDRRREQFEVEDTRTASRDDAENRTQVAAVRDDEPVLVVQDKPSEAPALPELPSAGPEVSRTPDKGPERKQQVVVPPEAEPRREPAPVYQDSSYSRPAQAYGGQAYQPAAGLAQPVRDGYGGGGGGDGYRKRSLLELPMREDTADGGKDARPPNLARSVGRMAESLTDMISAFASPINFTMPVWPQGHQFSLEKLMLGVMPTDVQSRRSRS